MIYIIRHGQTALNNAEALQGRSGHPLNENGVAQAKAAGAWFCARHIRFDRVYSSPLRRAAQTARLAAGDQTPVETDERLIEMDYGPYEGVSLAAPPPEILTFFSDFAHNPAPEGMEQHSFVVARLGAFLEQLRQDAPAGNILISTHAIAMKGALEYLTPASRGGYRSKYIGNCAVYQTQLAEGAYRVPVETLADLAYGGPGTVPANLHTLSARNYAFGQANYASPHYGYVTFTLKSSS